MTTRHSDHRAALRILLWMFAALGMAWAVLLLRGPAERGPTSPIVLHGRVAELDTAFSRHSSAWYVTVRPGDGAPVTFLYPGYGRQPPVWVRSLRPGDSLEIGYARDESESIQDGMSITSVRGRDGMLLTPAQAAAFREQVEGGVRGVRTLTIAMGVLAIGGLMRMAWTDRRRKALA